MSKNMAVIQDNMVINIISCSSDREETLTLIDMKERPVQIGDTCIYGKFYHDGVELLTPMEELQKQMEQLKAVNSEMATALEILEVSE